MASGAILVAGRKAAGLRPALHFLDFASFTICKIRQESTARDSAPAKCVDAGNALA